MRIALAGEDAGRRRRAVCDPAAVMPGRGAYLCRQAGSDRPEPACLQAAVTRSGIQRALRCAVTLDPELVDSVGR